MYCGEVETKFETHTKQMIRCLFTVGVEDLGEKQTDAAGGVTKGWRETKRNTKCERINKITARFSAHSFSPSPSWDN